MTAEAMKIAFDDLLVRGGREAVLPVSRFLSLLLSLLKLARERSAGKND
jgi:hypothetical protein